MRIYVREKVFRYYCIICICIQRALWKRQSRCKEVDLSCHSISEKKFCSICSIPIQVIVKEYVGVDKNFDHLFRMYARRSSLSISSWVKCPMPLICLNSLGSSGRSFQSVFSFVALALEARRCEVVIRRRALIAFSIIPSSVTMTFNSRNNSAFNCNAVIAHPFNSRCKNTNKKWNNKRNRKKSFVEGTCARQ